MSSISLFTPLRQSEVVQGPGRDFDLGPRTFPGCTWCPLTNLLLPGYIFFAFARKLITWRDPKETTATVAPALVTWTWSWEVVIPFNLGQLSHKCPQICFLFLGTLKKETSCKEASREATCRRHGSQAKWRRRTWHVAISYLTSSWTRVEVWPKLFFF